MIFLSPGLLRGFFHARAETGESEMWSAGESEK